MGWGGQHALHYSVSLLHKLYLFPADSDERSARALKRKCKQNVVGEITPVKVATLCDVNMDNTDLTEHGCCNS